MRILVLRSRRRPRSDKPKDPYTQVFSSSFAAKVIRNLSDEPGSCSACGPDCSLCREAYDRNFSRNIVGHVAFPAVLPYLLEEADNGLTEISRHYLQRQLAEWNALDEAIKELEEAIKQQVKKSEQARRLMKIKGVGTRIASAAEAFMGNGSGYQNGRHFAANLGLVPKEHSSGGKQKLGRITKRGNCYLRHLLIQGAWSVIRYADRGNDRLSRWAKQIMDRRGKHKAAIAVANKLARIIWAISYHQTEYKEV